MNINKLNQTIKATVFSIATVAATATTPSTTVVGAGAAMSIFALSTTPALAAQCQRRSIIGQGFSNALFNRAGVRRAKRRAISDWESKAKSSFGSKFADFDDAKRVRFFNCESVKGARGQSGFHRCSVSALACNG